MLGREPAISLRREIIAINKMTPPGNTESLKGSWEGTARYWLKSKVLWTQGQRAWRYSLFLLSAPNPHWSWSFFYSPLTESCVGSLSHDASPACSLFQGMVLKSQSHCKTISEKKQQLVRDGMWLTGSVKKIPLMGLKKPFWLKTFGRFYKGEWKSPSEPPCGFQVLPSGQ